MVRKKRSGKERNTKKRRRNVQNKAAMLGISSVVCMLLGVLLVEGHSLQNKIQQNEVRYAQLEKQLKEEQARTGEIEELQEYMQSDEYVDKIGRRAHIFCLKLFRGISVYLTSFLSICMYNAPLRTPGGGMPRREDKGVRDACRCG